MSSSSADESSGSTFKNIMSSLGKDMSPVSSLKVPSNSASSSMPDADASSSSPFSAFSEVTWQTWAVIVFLLALLGINIIRYVADGTSATADTVNEIFGPLLKMLGYTTLETTKQTTQVSGTGATAGIQAATNAITSTIDSIEGKGTTATSTSQQSQATPPPGKTATTSQQSAEPVQSKMHQIKKQTQNQGPSPEWYEETLDKALNNASKTPATYEDEIEAANATNKNGWCYIGTDRGTRTCSQVGANDMCMSGDIFPSQDICMNPSLRE